MTGGSRSIRFSTAPESIQHNELLQKPRAKKSNANSAAVQHNEQSVPNQVQLAPKPNALNALDQAWMDSLIIADLFKGIIASKNRHGDLQAMRSAAKNLIANVDLLIQAEEDS